MNAQFAGYYANDGIFLNIVLVILDQPNLTSTELKSMFSIFETRNF